jgi:hypothetical protein
MRMKQRIFVEACGYVFHFTQVKHLSLNQNTVLDQVRRTNQTILGHGEEEKAGGETNSK